MITLSGGGVTFAPSKKNILTGMYHADAFSGTTDGTFTDAGINAAIAAAHADALGFGTVYVPAGRATMATQIRPKSFVTLQGPGMNQCVLTASPTLATAIIQGTSGDAASDFSVKDLTLDANFTGGNVLDSAIQMANAPRFRADNVRFMDCARSGVLLLGTTVGQGCPNSTVTNCYMDGIWLAETGVGMGVMLQDQSSGCTVNNNIMINCKGRCIGGANTANGSPDHCVVSGNNLTMIPSVTGFESIGFPPTCDYLSVTGNVIKNSQDNGISASPDHSTVTGNVIDGCLNHGIETGSFSTVTGNTVRNCGQETVTSGASYAAFCLSGVNQKGGLIAGNVAIDDQTVHTMAYVVQMAPSSGTSQGGNVIGVNAGSGYTSTTPVHTAAFAATDIVLDTITNPGLTVKTLYAQAGATLNIHGSINVLTQSWVGSGASAVTAQCGIQSNATGRVGLGVAAFAAQTADLASFYASDFTTVLSGITHTGRFYSLDGVTTKSLGDISGLTSAAIDAKFAAVPPDGTDAVGNISGASVKLFRENGKWHSIASTLIT